MTICRTQMKMVKPNSFKNTSFVNHNGRIYNRLESCLVIPPPRGKKPKAIIKFLGGAFVGAVPEVTYSYLLEQLANEGYFIISVPYNVTFDHEKVTRQIYERFHAGLDLILGSGLPEYDISPDDIVDLPLYSAGHSNGALLQVLTGSYFCEKIPKANEIISYNNRPASEAVPYFEQVKFNVDAIDETDILEETLKPRVESIGAKLQKIILNGTHITPCIQEPRWQVGDIYSPVDAVAQGLKTISLNDTRVLTRTITDWFSQLEG